MRFTLRLVEITDPRNRKIIIKRLVSDLSVDFAKAEYLAGRLPVDVRRGATEDEAQKTLQDYERLGCRVTKIREQEEHRQPPAKMEPEKTAHAPVQPRISVSPHASPAPVRFSVRAVEIDKKGKSKAALAAQIVGLLLVIMIMASVLYLAGRKKPPVAAAPSPAGELTAQEQQTVEDLDRAEDSTLSDDQRMEILKRAMEKTPTDEIVKQRISTAYEEKAESEFSSDGRIRFFLMAIEFNPHNEGAWDGLIQAYLEAGMKEKADEAKIEKETRFREAHVKLNKLLNSFSTLEGVPKISGGVLEFSYRSGKTDERGLRAEMKRMALKIRGLRNFESIIITAIVGNGEVTVEF